MFISAIQELASGEESKSTATITAFLNHFEIRYFSSYLGTAHFTVEENAGSLKKWLQLMSPQIVVVVGLGASGIDIAREISQVTKEVHIASRQNEHRLGKISIDPYLNVWMHAEVQKNSEFSYSHQTPFLSC